MLHAPIAYSYQAAEWCPDCIMETFSLVSLPREPWNAEDYLDMVAEALDVDRYDEHSFDSYDFPKVIFENQAHEGCYGWESCTFTCDGCLQYIEGEPCMTAGDATTAEWSDERNNRLW